MERKTGHQIWREAKEQNLSKEEFKQKLVDNGVIIQKPVRIFKCPCDKKKYKLAGKPNQNPTLKEKREYGELISMGCEVVTISLEQFQKEDWNYCDCNL